MATDVKKADNISRGCGILTDEQERATDFFSKILLACRDLQTFSLMEDELRKITSKTKTDWYEDQRDLK